MADNTTVDPGSGGNTIRTLEDGSSIHWPAGVCAFATTVGTPDVLEIVRPGAGLPIAFNTAKDGTGTEYRPIVDADGHQQIDVLSSALPTGAATAAAQTTGNASLASIDGKITACNTGAVVVSSSALPSGAATAAKQPALGTAGTASTDVITVQGIAGAVAVKTDGSAVTQPVSGSVSISGTVTVGSHAVTNAGTFAVQESGAALTALQLIDNLVLAEDAAHQSGDPGAMLLAIRTDTPANRSGADGDYEGLQISAGRLWTSTLVTGSALTALEAIRTNSDTLVTQSSGYQTTFTSIEGYASQAAASAQILELALADTYDFDTGAGTDSKAAFGLLLPASGGAVVGGTSTNPIRVDPTGTTTQPVSGTVTANAGTNLNTSALALESGGNLAGAATSLAVIDDWDESDRCKVNPIVGQAGIAAGAGAVSASTPRVTLAADDPAVASLALIDNCISGNEAQVDVVAPLPAGTNNIGDVDVLSVPPSIRGPAEPTVDSYTSVAVSATANTANQQLVAAPGASKQIWVYGMVGTADTGDGTIALQDEDDTALSGVMPVSQRGGFAISPSGNFSMPWIKVPTNKALEIDTVTCGFKGVLSYGIVSV